MKKIIVLLGVVLISGMLFSCSNDADEDLSYYEQEIEIQNTGGEDGDLNPPPPPPTQKTP